MADAGGQLIERRNPLSERLLRGELWRYRSPDREERSPRPEIMEVMRRVEAIEMHAYEERRRKRDAERGDA
jgi:hypothetical protein